MPSSASRSDVPSPPATARLNREIGLVYCTIEREGSMASCTADDESTQFWCKASCLTISYEIYRVTMRRPQQTLCRCPASWPPSVVQQRAMRGSRCPFLKILDVDLPEMRSGYSPRTPEDGTSFPTCSFIHVGYITVSIKLRG